jgi:hypothetical protein|tara:strand:- start:149 stop:331 length:183 start_codon:yes stop_codon:yes gene_type:complete
MRYGSAESEYTLWMIDYFGRDFVDQMHRDKRKVKKMYAADYRDLLAYFKEQIKEQKERLG